MMKWLKSLFGGSDSASVPAEPVTAPEPESMPADAPPVPVETSEATGDEPEQPS
jgi:hypothetical protein